MRRIISEPMRKQSYVRRPVSLYDLVSEMVRDSMNGEEAAAPEFPAADILEGDESLIIRAELPGVNPDDIEVTLDGGVLCISGEKRPDADRSDESSAERGSRSMFHSAERRFGTFQRTFQIPVPVKEENVKARYERGVLELILPKAEPATPSRIPIRTESE